MACILTLTLVTILIGGCQSGGISDKNLSFLGPDEAMVEVQGRKRLLGLAGESVGTWVDARAASDFSAGHIPGAISLPLNRVADEHQQLKEFDVIVVYGESYADAKAEGLSKRLMELGHKTVYTRRGGMQAWTSAGNSTQSGE